MNKEENWLLQEKYNGEKTEGFFADCTRLQSGEPLAYILGWVPFLHTKIYLESLPLIPRVETEFWVEKIIQKIALGGMGKEVRALDMCAGSGCIGVAILHAIKDSTVDFAELETQHHATIRRNIFENTTTGITSHIFGGDLFTQVSGAYDYILSNPPYIDPKVDRAQDSVKQFEPAVALYGGKNGMEYIERIIRTATNYLTETGTLIIEHEPEQVGEIALLAEMSTFIAVTHPDQFGVLRYTEMSRQNPASMAK